MAQSKVPVPGPSPLPIASIVVTPAALARANTSGRSLSKRLFSGWQCESVYIGAAFSYQLSVHSAGGQEPMPKGLLQPCSKRHVFEEACQNRDSVVAERGRHNHALRFQSAQLARCEIG